MVDTRSNYFSKVNTITVVIDEPTSKSITDTDYYGMVAVF
tara:strand:+ start:343 stop:462 length:120 start_codon:yes stop_codon:yes gene_type:complete